MDTQKMEPALMSDMNRLVQARSMVYGYVKSLDSTPVDFKLSDVFIVWFTKTLQNWKAIVSHHGVSDSIYEVTHNGNKDETYLDVYDKREQVVFKND